MVDLKVILAVNRVHINGYYANVYIDGVEKLSNVIAEGGPQPYIISNIPDGNHTIKITINSWIDNYGGANIFDDVVISLVNNTTGLNLVNFPTNILQGGLQAGFNTSTGYVPAIIKTGDYSSIQYSCWKGYVLQQLGIGSGSFSSSVRYIYYDLSGRQITTQGPIYFTGSPPAPTPGYYLMTSSPAYDIYNNTITFPSLNICPGISENITLKAPNGVTKSFLISLDDYQIAKTDQYLYGETYGYSPSLVYDYNIISHSDSWSQPTNTLNDIFVFLANNPPIKISPAPTPTVYNTSFTIMGQNGQVLTNQILSQSDFNTLQSVLAQYSGTISNIGSTSSVPNTTLTDIEGFLQNHEIAPTPISNPIGSSNPLPGSTSTGSNTSSSTPIVSVPGNTTTTIQNPTKQNKQFPVTEITILSIIGAALTGVGIYFIKKKRKR